MKHRKYLNVSLSPGAELDDGKYRIVRLLGEGGMGAVYEAQHTRSLKRVAIKCLHRGRRGADADMERLVREAQASARVPHRNVVEVFDVGRDGPTLYLVMEYLEGETLRDALDRRELPAHRLIATLLQAMQGVAAAHKQGVIHRDIKPENIFLSRELDASEPVVKVLDFGISKLTVGDEQSALTATGAPLGTPLYMPYEQLCGLQDVDGRADVYAFGVVLYEALTGRLPYQARTLAELCSQVIQSAPVAPNDLCPELPTSLSRLVMWALRKDRDARLPSIKQLIMELEPFSTARGMQAELAAGSDDRAPIAEVGAGSPAFEPARPSTGRAPIPAISGSSGPVLRRGPKASRLWSGAALVLLALAALVPRAMLRDAEPTSAAERERSEPSPEPAPAGGAPVRDISPPTATAETDPSSAPPAAERPPVPKRARVPAPRERSPVVANLADTSGPAPSPTLVEARAHTTAAIERLTVQLTQCDELHTRWLRDQCRDDHKREIVKYEEQRELLESASKRR